MTGQRAGGCPPFPGAAGVSGGECAPALRGCSHSDACPWGFTTTLAGMPELITQQFWEQNPPRLGSAAWHVPPPQPAPAPPGPSWGGRGCTPCQGGHTIGPVPCSPGPRLLPAPAPHCQETPSASRSKAATFTAKAAGGSRRGSALSHSDGREGCEGLCHLCLAAAVNAAGRARGPGRPREPPARSRVCPAFAAKSRRTAGAEQRDPAVASGPARRWGYPARCSARDRPLGKVVPTVPRASPVGLWEQGIGAGGHGQCQNAVPALRQV